MTISTQLANQTLESGFTDENKEIIQEFPYGGILKRLWDHGDGYQKHLNDVIKKMDALLSDRPGDVLGNPPNIDSFSSKEEYAEGFDQYQQTKQLLSEMRVQVVKSFTPFDATTQLLFRLAALYHDIGKYIIKERHPIIGWYTMEYLDSDAKEQLLTLLGHREDYLELLLVMVRDHDEFGVLCTGEASYAILLNATTSLRNVDEDKRRILASIMWLNLADIAGTPKVVLTYSTVKKIYDDFIWYLEAIKNCKTKGQTLEEHVIKESGNEDVVVERISRLLIESSRNYEDRFNELTKTSPHGLYVHQLVRNQLRRVYTTHNLRQEFASEFAHVCKMDYCKRFIEALIGYCEGSKEKGSLGDWQRERKRTDTLIYFVFAILRRITSTYKAMIRSDDGIGNLIGVEMKDLTPENAPDKTQEICKLLVEEHYPGLSWMMSDCPAWFF
jgi:hypothetical protein